MQTDLNESCTCCHGAECPTHEPVRYVSTAAMRAEQRRNELLTTAALQSLARSLKGLVDDANRLNTEEPLTTEITFTGDEAALALKVLQNILKPLPPGTMTHG